MIHLYFRYFNGECLCDEIWCYLRWQYLLFKEWAHVNFSSQSQEIWDIKNAKLSYFFPQIHKNLNGFVSVNKQQGLTHLDFFSLCLHLLKTKSLFRSLSIPPSLSHFTALSITVPVNSPPQSDTSRGGGCSSELFNPRNAPNWKTARKHQEAATCQRWSFSSTLQPPPVTNEHNRQGAGLVDEEKFTNCLIIQISMIMNRYSTVLEHGVQPELPPQHSSCETWLLISKWLSGINNLGTYFKFPSCVFTVCACNCCTVRTNTEDWPMNRKNINPKSKTSP